MRLRHYSIQQIERIPADETRSQVVSVGLLKPMASCGIRMNTGVTVSNHFIGLRQVKCQMFETGSPMCRRSKLPAGEMSRQTDGKKVEDARRSKST